MGTLLLTVRNYIELKQLSQKIVTKRNQ